MKKVVKKRREVSLSLKKNGFVSIAFFISVFCFNPVHADAQGDLMIMPKRVVFDGNRRQQEVNLANNGHDTATYLISIVNMNMTDSGRTDFITQPDSAKNFADNYLRIYPRKVTLWPGKTQVIKVQATRYNQLAPGEYRSHIYIRPVTDEKPLGGGNNHQPDSADIAVRIRPVIGFAIPAIIRVGVSDVKVHLSDISVHKNGDGHQLGVTFNRQGNMSAYGALTVNYISPDGKETQVGFARGISIYATNPKRHFQLRLTEGKNIDYSKGSIHLTFKNTDPGRADILAESQLALSN